jgi:hypothetical protein
MERARPESRDEAVAIVSAMIADHQQLSALATSLGALVPGPADPRELTEPGTQLETAGVRPPPE